MTEWLTIPCPDCDETGLIPAGKFSPTASIICRGCDGYGTVDIDPDDIEEPA